MSFVLIILSFYGFSSIYGAQWQQVGTTASPMFDVGINSMNITFSSEFTPETSWLVESLDLGANWKVLEETNDGAMDLGVSALSDKKAVVTSILGRCVYTLDGGNSWKTAISAVFGVQGICRTKDKSEIYGGASNDKMKISKDFGATWHDFTIGNLSYGGRYAAMPTNETFYVTAGMWVEDKDQSKYHLSSRIKYNMVDKQIEIDYKPKSYRNINRKLLQPQDKIWGAIYKTSNGGSDWVEQFYSEDKFYFNGIDCCNENVCFAVAEGDSDAGSNDPGSRVLYTNNGGSNWNEIFHDAVDGASLMAVRCIGEKEAYAGGGLMVEKGFAGYIFHTVDAGNTWTNFTDKATVLAMDMNDDNSRGIAVAISKEERGFTYAYL